MVRVGIAIAVLGATLGLSLYTAGSFALPKYLCLATGAFVIWLNLLWRNLRSSQYFHWTPLAMPTALFLAIMIVCTIGSTDWAVSVFGHYRSYTHSLLATVSLLALAYGVAYSQDEASDKHVLCLFCVVAVLVPLYSIAQAFGLDHPAIREMYIQNDVTKMQFYFSSMGHPVYLGTLIAALFPLSIYAMCQRNSYWASVIGWICACLLVTAAVLTMKRGVWIGMGAGVLGYGCLAGCVVLKRMQWVILIGCMLMAFVWYVPHAVNDESNQGRIEAWKVAMRTFRENPMVGVGPEAFAHSFRKHKTVAAIMAARSSRFVQFSAHNDVLHIAATMGFYGLAAYALLLLGFGFCVYNGLQAGRRNMVAALAGGIIGVWAIAKIQPIPLSTMTVCAVMVGLIMRSRHIFRVSANPPNTRRWVLAGTFASGLVLIFVTRAFVADVYRQRGRIYSRSDALLSAQAFNQAAKWAPWEMKGRQEQARSLYALPYRATPEMGRRIAAEAVKIGRSSLWYHPNDADAHALYGSSLLACQFWGGPMAQDEAMAALDKAQKMAPMFRPLMRQRMAVARSIGERAKSMTAEKQAEVLDGFANAWRRNGSSSKR